MTFALLLFVCMFLIVCIGCAAVKMYEEEASQKWHVILKDHTTNILLSYERDTVEEADEIYQIAKDRLEKLDAGMYCLSVVIRHGNAAPEKSCCVNVKEEELFHPLLGESW